MTDKARVITSVRAAFEREPRINLHRYPVRLDFADDVLTVEGEAEHIAAKKLAMELAITVPGVAGIVDRLHVAPAARMGDGAIRDAVRDALLQESTLQDCTIRTKGRRGPETIRDCGPAPRGLIDVSVRDGVVLLDNYVPSLVRKRMAGVLAWWVPGSRDVINGLAVEPPQEDSDGEVAKAVRLALTKDRLIKLEDLRVAVKQAVVTLEGSVPTEAQKAMAEFDAWYVFGVDKVINKLKIG